MIPKLVRAVLVGIFVLVSAGTAAFLYLCWQINHTGTVDKAQPADAIIVLGARVEPDGQAGPDLWSRTMHGVRLYSQGLAPYLICTGGFQGDRLSAASVACSLAVSQGVPRDRVLLADGSMTTREDAMSARQIMASQGLEAVILVSHPLHLERARLLFEAQGITVYPSPTNTRLTDIPWRTRAWLTAREAVGIIWVALEAAGVPYEWTIPLSRRVYGALSTLSAGTN